MSTGHLNLRFTVAHVDQILAMARSHYATNDIAAIFSREHFPVTADEIAAICRDARQPVPARAGA